MLVYSKRQMDYFSVHHSFNVFFDRLLLTFFRHLKIPMLKKIPFFKNTENMLFLMRKKDDNIIIL
jgi:uncharacterized membrane protein required for colicin V production